MTAAIASEVRSRRSAPNYALRRAVVGAVAVCIALVAFAAAFAAVEALADLGGRPAAASEIGADRSPRLHVAQPGDSLWSIAEAYRGEVGQSSYVDALIDLNDGTTIAVGQAVRLP